MDNSNGKGQPFLVQLQHDFHGQLVEDIHLYGRQTDFSLCPGSQNYYQPNYRDSSSHNGVQPSKSENFKPSKEMYKRMDKDKTSPILDKAMVNCFLPSDFKMKILLWNCHGAGNPDFRRALRDLLSNTNLIY